MKIIRPQNNTLTKTQLLDEMTAISQECGLYEDKSKDETSIKDKIQENIVFYEKELSDLITGKMGKVLDYEGGQKYYRGLISGYKHCLEIVEEYQDKQTVKKNLTTDKEPLIDDNTGKDQKLFIYTKDESNIDIAKQTEDAYKNFCKDQTIENLMDEIIKQKDDKIQVTISLTKRQYDLYLKKGGESWIKRVITGQKKKVR